MGNQSVQTFPLPEPPVRRSVYARKQRLRRTCYANNKGIRQASAILVVPNETL